MSISPPPTSIYRKAQNCSPSVIVAIGINKALRSRAIAYHYTCSIVQPDLRLLEIVSWFPIRSQFNFAHSRHFRETVARCVKPTGAPGCVAGSLDYSQHQVPTMDPRAIPTSTLARCSNNALLSSRFPQPIVDPHHDIRERNTIVK